MENRFGVKDLVLSVLVVVVIVLVILQMFQYDRQWDLIRQSNRLLTEQTTDLAKIRRLVEQGGQSSGLAVSPEPGTATSRPSAVVGFERIEHSHQQADFAIGDNLVITFGVIPNKLSPLISTDAASSEIQDYVLDSLVARDPNTFKWVSRLAESWKISDDQLTIDFTLRRGVTFSDGSDLTADDVVFTFDMMRNEQIEAPAVRAYLDKLGTVTKTSDYGIRFVFKEPYFLSFEVAGASPVLSKKFYSQFSPTDYNRSTGYLFGSGPYRLPDPKSWKPEAGKPIELVRNERYWGPTPSFNKMVWKVIENPSARQTAFGNGETDVFNPSPDQFDQMLTNPDIVARTQHFAIDRPNSGFGFIGWNERIGRDGKPSQFADPRVRRAMTMLIDRESICKTILKGYATVNSGPFSTMTPQADPSIKPWPYDPAAAEKLLLEAGFVRNGSQLIGPNGKPFEFKLSYPVASSVSKRMVSFIRDGCEKAGIDVTPDPSEWSILLKKINDRDYEALQIGWTAGIETDAYQSFDSKEMAGVGDDFIQYNSPETDEAIEKARQEVNDEKRAPLWHVVHQLLHRDEPYTFLYIGKQLEFESGRLKGVDVTKLGVNQTFEWYVPKPVQKYSE
jgi:peptide/nickel transport system substrate-binding protein